LNTAQPALTADGKQAFFKGWAQLWPQQMSSDIALRMSASNVHAPGQWRTNGPLADTPAYGDAFKCKAGTPMQRAGGEQVSIWR